MIFRCDKVIDEQRITAGGCSKAGDLGGSVATEPATAVVGIIMGGHADASTADCIGFQRRFDSYRQGDMMVRFKSSTSLRCKTPGFTVPEVLAVIAIIAIILSILLPSFTAARYEATKSRCGAQMRHISLATRAYSVDNKGAVIHARSHSVQIAIDLSEQRLFEAYGYPKAHWRCPGRNYEPQLEASFGNQLVLGYQYFGGIDKWINHVGTFASKSPVKLTDAKPDWVVAADTTIKVDGIWGGGRPEAFGDMPSHKFGSPWPEGGFHTYVDGSAKWVPFDTMYMIHSWGPSSRLCFFRQDDLPTGLTLATLVPAKLHKP